MQNKVAFTTIWYGKLPKWFELTYLTMGNNNKIDFVLLGDFHDTDKLYSKYGNVQFVHFKKEILCQMILSKYNVNIKFSYRKLCDLKPFIGDLFQDYLKEYDYWSFSDIDLFYGNIQDILQKYIDSDYYVISGIGNRLCHGPFTLLKNTPLVNTLYKKTSFKSVLLSEKNLAFDEGWWKKFNICDDKSIFMPMVELIENFIPKKKCIFDSKIYSDHYDWANKKDKSNCKAIYKNNRLYLEFSNRRREVGLFHIIFWKKESGFKNNKKIFHNKNYIVNQNGIDEYI